MLLFFLYMASHSLRFWSPLCFSCTVLGLQTCVWAVCFRAVWLYTTLTPSYVLTCMKAVSWQIGPQTLSVPCNFKSHTSLYLYWQQMLNQSFLKISLCSSLSWGSSCLANRVTWVWISKIHVKKLGTIHAYRVHGAVSLADVKKYKAKEILKQIKGRKWLRKYFTFYSDLHT